MLSVTMLGRMMISAPDKLIRLDLGQNGRMLAGYLFHYQGRAHLREKLADMFWPELNAEQAKAALNTAVWRVRKILTAAAGEKPGGNLISLGSEIVLQPAEWLSVDTHEFSRLATRAAGDARAGKIAAETLEAAVDRYAGSFMEGDDAEWIVAERERLHSLYVRSLCDLVRVYALGEDFEAAIAAARKILVVDPFRETVVQWLALLLVLNGQRAQAITHLDRWCVALHNEIDIDPLLETHQLRESIVSGAVQRDIPVLRQRYFTNKAVERQST
jgi:DNA-binding SARP family transcriptional activator